MGAVATDSNFQVLFSSRLEGAKAAIGIPGIGPGVSSL